MIHPYNPYNPTSRYVDVRVHCVHASVFNHHVPGLIFNVISDQIDEINQYTLASALCESMDDVDNSKMQERALLKPWDGNIVNQVS